MCLLRQLARRTHHQPVRTLALLEGDSALVFESKHDHGEGEDERLAAACECDADEVPALEHSGDALHLDLSRPVDALALQRLQQGRGEPHVSEVLDWRGHVLTLNVDEVLLAERVSVLDGHLAVLPWRPPARRQPLRVHDAFGTLLDRQQRRVHRQLHLLQHTLLLRLQLLELLLLLVLLGLFGLRPNLVRGRQQGLLVLLCLGRRLLVDGRVLPLERLHPFALLGLEHLLHLQLPQLHRHVLGLVVVLIGGGGSISCRPLALHVILVLPLRRHLRQTSLPLARELATQRRLPS
mmetsp:Transcript_34074/g.84277  ORF Transcript_34074/g.84277 Transcript_34074/m.84277 type:complete len:294 (-) Transcript_34074:28-909(-)